MSRQDANDSQQKAIEFIQFVAQETTERTDARRRFEKTREDQGVEYAVDRCGEDVKAQRAHNERLGALRSWSQRFVDKIEDGDDLDTIDGGLGVRDAAYDLYEEIGKEIGSAAKQMSSQFTSSGERQGESDAIVTLRAMQEKYETLRDDSLL